MNVKGSVALTLFFTEIEIDRHLVLSFKGTFAETEKAISISFEYPNIDINRHEKVLISASGYCEPDCFEDAIRAGI